MQNTIKNYQQTNEKLQKLTNNSNVLLLPVSKKKKAEHISALHSIGVTDFAENYLQEALDKMSQLSSLKNINWHYIGQIQSKKTKSLAQHFNWIHTVDSIKYAKLLNQFRSENKSNKPLNVCIQVNLHDEEQKNGVNPNALIDMIVTIAQLEFISLRGLMLIGKQNLSLDETRQSFQDMKKLFNICKKNLQSSPSSYAQAEFFDTLSMGMSGDWQTAVSEGSTIVRLGTTIFGNRTY